MKLLAVYGLFCLLHPGGFIRDGIAQRRVCVIGQRHIQAGAVVQRIGGIDRFPACLINDPPGAALA